jgi:hypothetical protein
MAQRIRRAGDRVEVAFEEVEGFLASPAGRRLRGLLAAGAIVGSKLLFRIPGLRRYPLIRALDRLGGAALVLAFAQKLRDWEPTARRPVIIDLPPPPEAQRSGYTERT